MTPRPDAIEAGISAVEAALCGIDATALIGVMIMCLGAGMLCGIVLVATIRWT